MVIADFTLAFTITILFEFIVFILIKKNDKNSLLALFLINLITNPILNYFVMLNTYFSLFSDKTFILTSEVIVFIVEAILLNFSLRIEIKKALLYSFLINVTSFGIGLIIFSFLQ